MKIILASGSPRRRELLTQTGIEYTVDPADIDEVTSETLPAKVVEDLSRQKALAVAANHQDEIVLAADTVVAFDDKILGKPKDEEDAFRMLRELSGRTHQVYTGVTVISPSGQTVTGLDRTDVTFELLSDEDIISYVRSGEPMDKAGAYALQGKAGAWIARLNGSDTSVIGLPLYLVRRLLIRSGFPVRSVCEKDETNKG